MELREIVATVEGSRPSLSLCNVDAPPEVLDAVTGYFGPRHVSIRCNETDSGVPENVALLHDGPEFRAASSLRELYRFADPTVGAATATDIEAVSIPAVADGILDRLRAEYGVSSVESATPE